MRTAERHLRVVAPSASPAKLQRSSGSALVSFKTRDGRTVLDAVHQSGCCKIRFPRPESGALVEAVLINTAGGLTDDDHISTQVFWKPGTSAIVTSQAAERIYKSRGAPANITNVLTVAEGALAIWAPQETILFNGGCFKRRLDADIAAGGRLLACESTIFGRAAMGETVETGALFDCWRVRYGGKLVFADGFRLDARPRDTLARPCMAAGAEAIASIIYVAEDPEELLAPVRDRLAGLGSVAGCSVVGPVLVIRVLGRSGTELRRDLVSILEALLALAGGMLAENATTTGAALPRVWSC